MTREATGVRAPADSLSELADRLVETGMPWRRPRRRWRRPGRRTPGRRRCGSGGAWRMPAHRRRSARTRSAAGHGGDDDRRVLGADGSALGSVGAGNPLGTWPTSATSCAAEVERSSGGDAADDQHQRAGDRGAEEAQRRGSRERDRAHQQGDAVDVPSDRPTTELAPGVDAVGIGAGQLGSSPITTSIAAPARKPVITGFERNGRSTHPQHRDSRNSTPVAR